MDDDNLKISETDTMEFTENPFDHQNVRPEDIVRLFYTHDVPIIPVVSKRGILIGILKKQNIIGELSDIERIEQLKIDEFITRNAIRMNFDDLIPYGKIREFVVINIFGEIQGKWSRIQLFTACDNSNTVDHEIEIKKQQDDQVLDWMIYLILEHIPRALYAVNENGKTIFYNSHFEDLYFSKYNTDIDVKIIERLFSDPMKNELFSKSDDKDLFFHNSELGIFYEKIPLMSSEKKAGFLIFCDKKGLDFEELIVAGVDLRGESFQNIVEAVERQIIIGAIRKGKDLDESADLLKLTRQGLSSKIKKFGIELDKSEKN
jgi:transcriptional regulator with PAS, ATPase and Fis domain